jgi:hypothetical protein
MEKFYDYSTLTDDQLYEKLRKAHAYLSMQKSLGHSDTVNSIEFTISALEDERTKRIMSPTLSTSANKKMKKAQEDLMKKDLEPITLGKLDDEL